jgi:uncharacterized protein YajQ (UPF0234 family)
MGRTTEQQDTLENTIDVVARELHREFHGIHSDETIRMAARESVIEFASDDVRIKTFIPVLARRAARSRLKQFAQQAS